jgi:hypothetical protein
MRPSSFALYALWIAASLCSAQSAGSIHVTVLDENQKPVSSAQVMTDPAGVLEDMVSTTCVTGEDGTCTIGRLEPGQWVVYAFKYRDGYPRPSQFFQGRNFKQTVVKLTESGLSESVVVDVGPKQGFLKLIVTDALTGKEIMPVSFDLRWVSDSSNWMETGRGDSFIVLVPANVPLAMVASSEGYEDWAYASSADHALLLHSGEKLTLHIRLQPKH